MDSHVLQAMDRIKKERPSSFDEGLKVLDCGSLDINGSNRIHWPKRTRYTGVDLAPGKNVDIVAPVHVAVGDLLERHTFDVVISTDMLEHDIHWEDSIIAMAEALAPKGLMILTWATPGYPEHGTTDKKPRDSPHTNHYYRNLSIDEVRYCLVPDADFFPWTMAEDARQHKGLFWGVIE